MRRTIEAGEFQNLTVTRRLDHQHQDDVEALERRWSNLGTEVSAAELIGAQLVAGNTGSSHPAAHALVNSDNPTYRALAQRVLGSPELLHEVPDAWDRTSPDGWFRSKIAESKRGMVRDPRNPITWSDMARRYTVLGQVEQAEKALRIARALAPESRYLLRISSRFYIHINKPGAAAHLLRQSARTNEDPWLMATLLSAASLDRRQLPGIRVARRILDASRFEPIEKSDLVSELATLELKAGSDRSARKLFKQSLWTPTDNSLAQAEWASHKLTSLDVEPEQAQIPFRAEALAQSAAQRGEWELSLAESWRWLDDQPFDAGAAIHTSYVAAIGLEDWAASARAAQVGLRANPTDSTLANNCAYALIEMGDLEAAEPNLRAAAANARERLERVAIGATTGLYEFRRGKIDAGRDLYRQAIDLARRSNEAEAEAMARSMLAREELRTGHGMNAIPLLDALMKLSKRVRDPGVLRCIDRAAQLANFVDLHLQTLDG